MAIGFGRGKEIIRNGCFLQTKSIGSSEAPANGNEPMVKGNPPFVDDVSPRKVSFPPATIALPNRHLRQVQDVVIAVPSSFCDVQRQVHLGGVSAHCVGNPWQVDA